MSSSYQTYVCRAIEKSQFKTGCQPQPTTRQKAHSFFSLYRLYSARISRFSEFWIHPPCSQGVSKTGRRAVRTAFAVSYASGHSPALGPPTHSSVPSGSVLIHGRISGTSFSPAAVYIGLPRCSPSSRTTSVPFDSDEPSGIMVRIASASRIFHLVLCSVPDEGVSCNSVILLRKSLDTLGHFPVHHWLLIAYVVFYLIH